MTNIAQYSDPQFPLVSYAYTLDAVGNRTGVVEGNGTSLTWGYDTAYRLTSEQRLVSGTPVYSAAYEYDPVGNRTEQTVNGQVTTYTYNNLDQMTSAGSVTYGYDGRGNLHQVTDGASITTFNYDARDRLASVTLPDTTNLAYVYDTEGHRVRETVGTDVTNYLWDELSPYGDVVLESDGSGTPLTSYVLVGSHLLSQRQNNTTSYYLSDGQGSIRGLTDTTGIVTDTYTYTAFGELYNSTGATDNAYLYTGQQFDDLTELYSLRARYYDPSEGRFLSQDTYPVDYSHPIELNRYVYTANDPINFRDPLGLGLIDYTVPQAEETAPSAPALAAFGQNQQGLIALTLVSAIFIGAVAAAIAYAPFPPRLYPDFPPFSIPCGDGNCQGTAKAILKGLMWMIGAIAVTDTARRWLEDSSIIIWVDAGAFDMSEEDSKSDVSSNRALHEKYGIFFGGVPIADPALDFFRNAWSIVGSAIHVYISIKTPSFSAVLDNYGLEEFQSGNVDANILVRDYQSQLTGVVWRECEVIGKTSLNNLEFGLNWIKTTAWTAMYGVGMTVIKGTGEYIKGIRENRIEECRH